MSSSLIEIETASGLRLRFGASEKHGLQTNAGVVIHVEAHLGLSDLGQPVWAPCGTFTRDYYAFPASSVCVPLAAGEMMQAVHELAAQAIALTAHNAALAEESAEIAVENDALLARPGVVELERQLAEANRALFEVGERIGSAGLDFPTQAWLVTGQRDEGQSASPSGDGSDLRDGLWTPAEEKLLLKLARASMSERIKQLRRSKHAIAGKMRRLREEGRL